MRIERFVMGDEDQKRGNFSLFYGKSGAGKTATALQTAEDPIFHILAERGQEDLTIKAISRPDLKLMVGYYEGWDDLLATVYNYQIFIDNKIKTCLFDGLTHVMNIHLADEIMEEDYNARDTSKDKGKDLTYRTKMSLEGFGTLSKQMGRLMKGFEALTKQGIDVICTARDQENPKWNRDLACAPALSGKEFPRDFKGFFDFIGLVESRFDENGEVVYPPVVSCDDDGSYLSKWTGVKPPGGVIRKIFNVQMMMKIAHGDVKFNGKED
jgi:hypothetical protein